MLQGGVYERGLRGGVYKEGCTRRGVRTHFFVTTGTERIFISMPAPQVRTKSATVGEPRMNNMVNCMTGILQPLNQPKGNFVDALYAELN